MTQAQKLNTGIVNIGGKDYVTVARRVADFRESHPGYTIETKILSAADVVQIRARIRDEGGRLLATGTAEEVRGQGNINKTSALENAETSAVGRALAFLGFGGTEIASADEIANALEQQKEVNQLERLLEHNRAVRDHIESIVAIKTYLDNSEWDAAAEAIQEIPREDVELLWMAPSRGGVWSTAQRAAMKSDNFNAAMKARFTESE